VRLVRFAEPASRLPSSPTTWPSKNPDTLERAVRFIEGKRLMTPREFNALRDQYKSAGFKIAGVQNKAFLRVARDSVARSAARGLDRRGAGAALNRSLARAGYVGLEPWHARLVANMAVASGYGRSSWEALHDPRVRGIIPAFQYRTQEDAKVRPEHASMNRRIYKRTWGGWVVWWPPNGYNCRCYVIGVTKRTIDAYGIKPTTKWPTFQAEDGRPRVRARPDDGFEGNPGSYIREQSHPSTSRERKAAAAQGRSRR